MRLFHRHHWVEVGRKFNPPTHTVTRAQNSQDELVLQITYGLTTVEFRCEECGRVTGVGYAGDSGVRADREAQS